MAAASLLARLAHAADPHNTERFTWKDNDLEAAVMRHLDILLATRQGSSLTCPDFGIPEVTEVGRDFVEGLGVLQRAIKNTIQTYEPRLKNVQVRHVKNETEMKSLLQFEVSGQIVHPDGRRQSVRFETGLDGNGKVRVSA